MSYRLQRLVRNSSHLPFNKGQQQLLALLACYGNDDGTSIFPTYQTLADKSKCCYRSIQMNMRFLLTFGILIKVVQYRKAYRRNNEYIINMEMLTNKPVDNSVDNPVDNSCINNIHSRKNFVGYSRKNCLYTYIDTLPTTVVGATHVDAPPQQPFFEDDVLEVKEEEPVIIPEQQPFFEDDVLAVKEDGPVIIPEQQPLFEDDVLEVKEEEPVIVPEGMILNPEGWVFYGKLDLVEITCVLANVANGVMEKEKVRLVQRNTAMNVLKIPHSGAWAMGYEEPLLKLVAFRDKIWITIPVAANTPRHTMRC